MEHGMELINDLMNELHKNRWERLAIVEQTIDYQNPNVINNMIADTINILENLYIALNLPQEGFIPTTPTIDQGEQDGKTSQ